MTADGAKGNRDAARAHEAYEVLGPMNAPGSHWGGTNAVNKRSKLSYKSYAERKAAKSENLGEDIIVKPEVISV